MDAPRQSRPIIDIIIHSSLEDGTKVCIRSIRPTDEARMRQGIEQLSMQSRTMRFFSSQPMPSPDVIERLTDADGNAHIAWAAIHTGDCEHPAIGAVHAVRNEPSSSTAEFSVAIVDAYHGLGLARMLIAVLLINCRLRGVESLDVHILSENRPAQGLIRSLGAQRCKAEYGVSEYILDTAGALEILRSGAKSPGLQDVFTALADYT